MKKVLVISGHTDLATSVANKTILDTIGQYLPETEIVKLDTLYPTLKLMLTQSNNACWKPTLSCCNFQSSGTAHPPYWNAGWKKHSGTASLMAVPATNWKAKRWYSHLPPVPRKKCILTKGQWGIRLKSSYLATKPHVIFAKWNLRDISILVA